jgi:hypothetical protein
MQMADLLTAIAPNAGSGLIILVLIVLANYYQYKTMRRFSGVIGKVMLWYSLGLATLLMATIFNFIVFTLNLDIWTVTYGDRVFSIVAILLFLKGARVIR